MFQISNTSLIVGLFTLLIFNANTAVKGQGRKIDVEIIVHTPKSGDTIISRKNQTYTGKFIIKNGSGVILIFLPVDAFSKIETCIP